MYGDKHIPSKIDYYVYLFLYFGYFHPVWPDKNRQMSIKVAQKGFTRKMNDFDTFTKIA